MDQILPSPADHYREACRLLDLAAALDTSCPEGLDCADRPELPGVKCGHELDRLDERVFLLDHAQISAQLACVPGMVADLAGALHRQASR